MQIEMSGNLKMVFSILLVLQNILLIAEFSNELSG